VLDDGYWEQGAAGEYHAAGHVEPYGQLHRVMPPEYSGGLGGEAIHFLSPHKTGLDKI
jgi:hypothetical protein